MCVHYTPLIIEIPQFKCTVGINGQNDVLCAYAIDAIVAVVNSFAPKQDT